MATLSNRSRYTVQVARRPELTRQFPHSARVYLQALRAQGQAPKLTQGDDRWLVRIRQKGRPELNFYTRVLDGRAVRRRPH